MTSMLQHLDDPTPLPPAPPVYRDGVHRRATVLRRRRAALTIGVPLAAAAAAVTVGVVWVLAPGTPAAPPVSPAPTASSPAPAPTASPTIATDVSSCGHGAECPPGSGPFRLVLDSGLRTDARPAVSFELPEGYRVTEAAAGGILVSPVVRGDSGLTALWPVRGEVGGDRARAVATWLAGMPSAVTAEPVRTAIGGRTAWRVVLATEAPDRTSCLDPTRGLYLGENYLGFDQWGTPCVVWFEQLQAGDPPTTTVRTPVGSSRKGLVEITLVSNLGVDAPEGADMLALWRWGDDLESSPTADILRSVRITTIP